MPLIYITGPTGSGKSTVRSRLRELGFEAYDTDEDKISRHYNRETGQEVQYPRDADRAPGWHAEHAFKMSEAELAQLAKQASGKTVFLCGMAANDTELSGHFDKILCLVIDEKTMEQRVATRKTNFFGKSPDELAIIKKWFKPTVDKYREAGATIVDATQPLDKVVKDILNEVESK